MKAELTAEITFMKETAGCTCLDYKMNVNMTKELNTQPGMEFIEDYRAMFYKCFAEESLSKFFITNQWDEGLWGDPTNTSIRP